MASRFSTISARFAVLALAMLAVSACNRGSQGVRFTNDGSGAGAANRPVAEPIRQFGANEIKTAIVGKTFQYTRADGNGFVTYNADGTMSIQDDVKGEITGRWGFLNGQYCEVFGPKALQECGEFKATGDAYFAAKSRLVEMKV